MTSRRRAGETACVEPSVCCSGVGGAGRDLRSPVVLPPPPPNTHTGTTEPSRRAPTLPHPAPRCPLAQNEGFEHDKLAYWIMVLVGVGVLLPWNVILNTLDFLDNKFPHADIPSKVTPAYVWIQLPLLGLMVKVSGGSGGVVGWSRRSARVGGPGGG
jgi:hypothetical protein